MHPAAVWHRGWSPTWRGTTCCWRTAGQQRSIGRWGLKAASALVEPVGEAFAYIYTYIYYYLIMRFTVIYVLYLKLYHFWYIWIAIYHISMYNISHIVSINILCQVYTYIYILGNHHNIAQLASDWWVTYSHSSDCGHGSEIGPTKLQLFVSSHPFDPFAGNILVRISGLFGDGKDFGHGTSPLNHAIYFIQWLKKLCRFQGPEA